MRILASVLALHLGLIAPLTIHAQAVAPFDSAQMSAIKASVMQMNKPADFVLQHRVELALSVAQISTLETLAVAQGDSMVVRQARMIARIQATPPSSAMLAAGSWSGDVDERALREAMCQSSVTQADMVIGIARDRRAAAAVLTEAQAARLPQLMTDDMLKSIKRL